MFAYDYPLLGLFWTMLIIFLWVAWIVLLFRTITDIFRSRDMGGVSKAVWLLFLVLIPWLGVLIYIVVHGGGMAERELDVRRAQQEHFDSYIRQTAGGGGGTADELTKLAGLRDSGVINEAEFTAQKARILG